MCLCKVCVPFSTHKLTSSCLLHMYIHPLSALFHSHFMRLSSWANQLQRSQCLPVDHACRPSSCGCQRRDVLAAGTKSLSSSEISTTSVAAARFSEGSPGDCLFPKDCLCLLPATVLPATLPCLPGFVLDGPLVVAVSAALELFGRLSRTIALPAGGQPT